VLRTFYPNFTTIFQKSLNNLELMWIPSGVLKSLIVFNQQKLMSSNSFDGNKRILDTTEHSTLF
jgi:hypothetical protein